MRLFMFDFFMSYVFVLLLGLVGVFWKCQVVLGWVVQESDDVFYGMRDVVMIEVYL